jgi:hypothetical protein
MKNSSKFDAYLLAELPRLNALPANALVSIGISVVADDARQMTTVQHDLNKLFAEKSGCRLTPAHWPDPTRIWTAYLTADVTIEVLTTLENVGAVQEIQLCADKGGVHWHREHLGRYPQLQRCRG